MSPSEVAQVRQRMSSGPQPKSPRLGARRCRPDPTQRILEDPRGALTENVSEIKGGVNQRMNLLLNKGKILRDLVTHPVALELAEHVLGANFLLSSFTANIAKKGGMLEPLHRDNWWHPVPACQGEAYVRVGDRERYTQDSAPKGTTMPPCGCNVIWLLTDFTEENGGTRLVPGSHLLPVGPESSVPYKVPTIAATGKAGSIVFFDGRLWHGTGQNLTDEPGIGLLTFYVGPQFRQNENFFLGLDPAVLEQSPERVLDLLGYTTWFYFGQTDALSSRKRLRARELWIPELRLKTR
ncbi:phytanoyl-CoA dioxygenase family protein [Bradyrhizobium sp. 157]|nr:phytanoyl-CoA dioxygenase family protein [Bradyrhizobium sp. 157]